MTAMRKIRTQPAGLVLALLLSTCLAATASGAAVSVGNGYIAELEATTSVSITLDTVPDGLSGYIITVVLSDPSKAQITGVDFPSWASMTDETVSGASATMKAVDLHHDVEPGGVNIDLGTLTIQGIARGECRMSITVDRLEDDGGYPISASTRTGLLRVGQYELTVNVDPQSGGDVSVNGVIPTAYPYMTSFECSEIVRIAAVGGTCYVFDRWTGDIAASPASPTNVIMDGDKSVTAIFMHNPSLVEDFTKDVGAWTEYDPNGRIEMDFVGDQRLEFTDWTKGTPGSVSRTYVVRDFILAFDMHIANSNEGAELIGPGFADSRGASDEVQNGVYVVYYAGASTEASQLGIGARIDGVMKFGAVDEARENRIAINGGVTYYVRLEKSGVDLVLSVFSDLDRTRHVDGSPKVFRTNFSSTVFTCFYAVNYRADSVAVGTATGWIDNIQVCGSK